MAGWTGAAVRQLAVRAALPFTLTDSQDSAIDAVRPDMGRAPRLRRLSSSLHEHALGRP